MIFEQTHRDTKFIFVLEQAELKVTKLYNHKAQTYTHKWDMNEITVSDLAQLVDRFKKMPTEMWELVEPERCENFRPQNVSKGVRRVGA